MKKITGFFLLSLMLLVPLSVSAGPRDGSYNRERDCFGYSSGSSQLTQEQREVLVQDRIDRLQTEKTSSDRRYNAGLISKERHDYDIQELNSRIESIRSNNSYSSNRTERYQRSCADY